MVVDESEGEFGENERIWFIEGRSGKVPRWHNWSFGIALMTAYAGDEMRITERRRIP
jgi:hypothetical protein